MSAGTAGWGFAHLALGRLLGRQELLDSAWTAGELLVQTAHWDGEACSWRDGDEPQCYGFGDGASGIALFLANLFAVTGDERHRRHAAGGLEFELRHRVEGELGWQWPRYEGEAVVYRYFLYGSAGIAAALIRCAALLDLPRYDDLARRIGSDTFVKYAFVPGLFEGMAGIGELMLDLHQATGLAEWRERALEIADTILWFRVERPEGTAFPGGWLTRISNDDATGAAGIGLFFRRLLGGGPRAFVDLERVARSGD